VYRKIFEKVYQKSIILKIHLTENMQKTRCAWVKMNNPVYVAYHDDEWGRPCYDERRLFEMLLLEGAQA
jgi:hypothetical protein